MCIRDRNYIVDVIDSKEEKIISGKYFEALDLSDNMKFVSIINTDGSEADFSDIKEKSVLSVAQNGEVIRAYICEDSAEGTIGDVYKRQGLMRFYIANWEASSSKLFIKYINVYQYVTAPVLTSATASNDTGEITEVNEDATIPGGTNKMTFKFDDELVSASQELFSVTDTDNGNVIDLSLIHISVCSLV